MAEYTWFGVSTTLHRLRDGFRHVCAPEAFRLSNIALIGTGPYKLNEWTRDAVMRFERFADCQSAPGDTTVGYGGKKFAYLDAIEFIPVPDEAAPVAGLQAGDYHISLNVVNDQYEVLKDYQGVIAEILTPTNWGVFFLNRKSPITGNLAMRQAVQAALDHKPMLQSGQGADEFIRLDPRIMMQQTPWYGCRVRAGDRNARSRDSTALHLSERALAVDRALHLHGCLRDHLGSLAFVPRRGGRARNADLGQHAARWTAGLATGLVARNLPWLRARDNGSDAQLARRRPTGRLRSPRSKMLTSSDFDPSCDEWAFAAFHANLSRRGLSSYTPSKGC
jgi:hypothetical protein